MAQGESGREGGYVAHFGGGQLHELSRQLRGGKSHTSHATRHTESQKAAVGNFKQSGHGAAVNATNLQQVHCDRRVGGGGSAEVAGEIGASEGDAGLARVPVQNVTKIH